MISMLQKQRLLLVNLCYRLAVLFSAIILWSWTAWAITPAGAIIKNQASATYRDAGNQLQSTTSNQVQTLVQEVIGVDLVQSQTKNSAEAETVLFVHFLTNTGNAPESYTVCIDQTVFDTTDDFDYASAISLFSDTDLDGQPDVALGTAAAPAIAGTPSDGCWNIPALSGGDSIQLVAQGTLPSGLTEGDSALFSIRAYSNTDSSVNRQNTDTLVISNEPVIEIIKTMDANSGTSPSGPYTVTLTYRNTSNVDAQNLIIEEILPNTTFGTVLPGGMTYIPNTASWQQELASGSASISLLTDSDEIAQSDNGLNVVFCAYDASCANAPFADDRMVLQINSVPAGREGIISFQINIDDNIPANETLVNDVNFTYENLVGTVIDNQGSPFESNAVTFVIIDIATEPDVVVNDTDANGGELLGVDDSDTLNNLVYGPNYDGSNPATNTVPQGENIIYRDFIWNTGNGEDNFNIQVDNINDREGNPIANPFPAGTTFQLFAEDGVTPLLDTSGDGIIDTGPLDPNENFEVVVVASLPFSIFGDNGGFGWQHTLRATSTVDNTKTNAVSNLLAEITTSEVDLTNAEIRDDNAADANGDCVNDDPADASCNGEGDGPKSTPANSFSVVPGNSTVIPLWVHNIGGASDTFNLAYSDQIPFVEDSIPTGWTVTFFENSAPANDCSVLGNPTLSTGAINANSQVLVCAQVSIDASVIVSGIPTEDISIYFQVLSPLTGETDIKHDQIQLVAQPEISLFPDNTGQVNAGSFVLYSHEVANLGNTALECVNLSAVNDLAADGWTSQFILDVNGDGFEDAGDVPLTTQTLAVGASFDVIIKIFAPANAADGIVNISK